eukprot:gene4772-9496_t
MKICLHFLENLQVHCQAFQRFKNLQLLYLLSSVAKYVKSLSVDIKVLIRHFTDLATTLSDKVCSDFQGNDSGCGDASHLTHSRQNQQQQDFLLILAKVKLIGTFGKFGLCSKSQLDRLNFERVFIEFGTNLGEHVKMRVITHLKAAGVEIINGSVPNQIEPIPFNSLILTIGNVSKSLIPSSALDSLPYESFVVISKIFQNNTAILACNGRPLDPHKHTNVSFNKDTVHYGAVLSTYVCLEKLGFAFLHPLSPYVPSSISLESKEFNITESPYWPSRIFHIHTQHPLELTEVLQGMDIPMFGPHGPNCETVNPKADPGQGKGVYCERWEDMVDDVDKLFEWSIANRLNAIEWLLLGNFKWGDFDTSDSRLKRLRVLTSLGHAYSLQVGADAPLGNIQQHAWYMVNINLPFEQQVLQIHARVDWIFTAGFDFLSTESGLSEFTHPECDLMLDLLNAYATYVNVTWGREAAVKVHCSTGQTCDQYSDPRTGEPVNFNFLPMFAVPQLGVLPHTVQVYGLNDPTAGSYGNAQDFGYMEDYMFMEAQRGNRSVVFYGETAYWVNVDIDVPLFLPLYGQRRMKDLQRIAKREIRDKFRIEGQMNFDSGWEWGYWMSDVVTARASWDPFPGGHGRPGPPSGKTSPSSSTPSPSTVTSMNKDNECTEENGDNSSNNNSNRDCQKTSTSSFTSSVNVEEEEEWLSLGAALRPVTNIFGTNLGDRVLSLLVRLARAQAELLVLGRVDGKPCKNLAKLTGIAYMSGVDTWVEIPRMLGVPLTQADKIHMDEPEDPEWPLIAPLLQAMENTFTNMTEEMYTILIEANTTHNNHKNHNDIQPPHKGGRHHINSDDNSMENIPITTTVHVPNQAAIDILYELYDCINMLALRASQIRMLYASRDINTLPVKKAELQTQSRRLLRKAAEVVSRRENSYRVPWQRIASWRDNPTVYRFGYLWSVHSLYYWWRDQGLAEQGSLQSERSPCYLNRMDASEVAVGWGYSAFEFLNCVAPPEKEYLFPQDLYHY